MRTVVFVFLPILAFSISGNFFGINYWWFEKLSPQEREIITEKLSEMEIDVVRIGGLWYDAMGISLKTLKNFFELCEELQATPMVQIPLNGHTVDEMLNFVKTVREIFKGRIIWSIGNEPDIYGSSGFDWVKPEGREEVLKKFREFLRRFKKNDDLLVIPDLAYRWRSWQIGSWTKYFTKFERDAFSIHRYPFRYVLFESQIINDVLSFSSEMKRLKKDVGRIAITETNLSWDWNFRGELSPEGDLAGLWMVSIYIRAMVEDVWNVSIWSAVNDGSLSILNVRNGRIEERGTFKAMKVFKNVDRDLKSSFLSRYLDWVMLGDDVVVVNRLNRSATVKVDSRTIIVGGKCVVRFRNWKKIYEWCVEDER